jgi:glutamate 5-kinase
MNRLLELGALPIINENDSVATNEIKVGDNDTLSAYVAKSINADLLVLLSDIDGLYTADPKKDKRAKLISVVDDINDDINSLGGGEGSLLGTGGMKTKLHAGEICMQAGVDMIITNGEHPENIYKIIDGESVGTLFKAKNKV